MRVEVQNYKEEWLHIYEEESCRITDIFGDNLVAIHHIGSTSVPGLKAKPIIDIMPVVVDIEKVDRFNEEMRRLGYEALGEYGIEGRRYFRKGPTTRTHHVHIFQVDNNRDINRHLAVRDYLKSHEDIAVKYGDLKDTLAREHPEDMAAYIEGKSEFVKTLETMAVEWYEKKNDINVHDEQGT